MAKRTGKKRGNQTPVFSLVLRALINPVSLTLIVAVSTVPLWNRYQAGLPGVGNQPVSNALLHLNEQPSWIIEDVKIAAIRDSQLDRIQLSDPETVDKVVAALAVQPWIKSVQAVQKNALGLWAEVQWRIPQAVVEFEHDLLVPVDSDGVVLDGTGLSPDDTFRLWRISIPQPIANGLTTGEAWNDLRIRDAVAIIDVVNEFGADFGLMRVVNRSYPTSDRLRLQPYELWTAAGTIVVWGSPPGKELKGEASAAAKLAGLNELIKSRGPLDQCGIAVIDVRTGRAVAAQESLALGSADFLQMIK